MSNLDSQKVTEHINTLESPNRETVEFLREIFLSSNSEISEHIKWNSPSFYYSGEMKEFDAKEYNCDLAVLNLHRVKILIVFPTGNKIDNETLKGKDYPDGRKIVDIQNLADAKNKRENLEARIKNWIGQIEK